MTTRPFDPRLPRRVPEVRRHLAVLGFLGAVAAAIVITQAVTLAAVLAAAAQGRLDSNALAGFVAAVAARAGWVWLSGVVAARTAARVKLALRGELFAAVGRRGPGWLAGQRAGELATLAGRGLDGLDPYVTGYLPHLVLAVTVPVAVLAQLTLADWPSAVIVALTLPLVPVFGMLVGWQTRVATRRQWRRLSRLGGHFLDMVTGLPTLRVFGRARAQVRAVREMADRHRVATMRTLRIAFLSALVLELVAAVAVALVAVPVGLRLLAGGMSLHTGLLVLLLVPEAFAPLRTAGARFHASVEGLTALDEAFATLGDPPAGPLTLATPAAPAVPVGPVDRVDPVAPGAARPVRSAPLVELADVTVAYDRTVALSGVSLRIMPGERVALIGPSGSGKSTLLALLLGFVRPTAGRVVVGGVDLADADLDAWRRALAWVPQRPHLFAGTLADNIRLGAPDATAGAVRAAVSAAALDEVVAGLPDGLDTVLGERGYGLSSGQRQRVALARAFLRDAPVVLLDEPTAQLDAASEAAVCEATARLVAGRTTLLVAHRPALLSLADRVVRLVGGRVVADVPADGRTPLAGAVPAGAGVVRP
ncbi:MAG TPA: thiol reductant ABC exporter subunit CydD [Natronosporangium sp.]|nr:thiol reductant ABC exporter subunit CydD [Natronosporangium sp.]